MQKQSCGMTMWVPFLWFLASGFFLPVVLGAQQASELPVVWGPQEPPFRPERPIVIQGGTLIDATGAAPKLDHAVVIEGERITWVGPMKNVKILDGAQVIDAQDMTIMPGLINSNQHIQLNPIYPAPTADLPFDELMARWEETFARMPMRAFVYLMQGVTSQRQTSGPSKRLLPIKQAIDKGEIAGPRIFLGGALFTSPEHFESYTRQAKTPADAIDWMRNEFAYTVVDDLEEGTDRFLGPEFNYWKLYMSGEIYDGKNDFSDEDLRFIIDKAHKNGKIIDVHCGGHNDGLRRMVAFDVDTLEHPFLRHELVEEDIIEGYVKNGVIIDSLLVQSTGGAQPRGRSA